jgi:hypothetical protein
VTTVTKSLEPASLLGLPPAEGGQVEKATIAMALTHRLNPPPWGTFSPPLLNARTAWLEHAAAALRAEPAVAPQGPASELAQLVLQLETGAGLTAYEQAEDLSHRIVASTASDPEDPLRQDLQVLLAHSCQAAAQALHEERRFEAEDQILARGIGQLGPLGAQAACADLQLERDRLVPYRVLDLLSREPGDAVARRRGLELLDSLISRCGGLTGPGDAEVAFDQKAFGSFQSQIRTFLTQQEWSDCCERSFLAGDPTALRPLAEAMVATGFQQRKPDRLEQVLGLLEQDDHGSDDQMLSWLYLLLGDVAWALALDEDVQTAASGKERDEIPETADQSRIRLERLWKDCHQWLSLQVLPGCMDSQPNMDLESWFRDRQVLAYLNSRETTGLGSLASLPSLPKQEESLPVFSFGEEGAAPAQLPMPRPAAPLRRVARSSDVTPAQRARNWIQPDGNPVHPRDMAPVAFTLLGAGLTLGIQGAAHLWTEARTPAAPTASVSPSPDSASRSTGRTSATRAVAKNSGGPPSIAPLRASAPTAGEVKALLQGWLDMKAQVLAGKTPLQPLHGFASGSMVAALKTLREGDAERHLTQKTLSRVERIQVVERSDEQITIAAQIRYADEIADANGTVVERNRLMRLRNTYTFTRTDGSWKLTAWNQTAPGEPLAEISDPLQGGPA